MDKAVSAGTIAQRNLTSCRDVAGIFDLFRQLHYPVEAQAVGLTIEADELRGGLRDQVEARYLVAEIPPRRLGEQPVTITLFVLKPSDQKAEIIRGIAQQWTQRFVGNHLLLFVARERDPQAAFRQITFVNTRRLGEGSEVKIKLNKLIVEREHPTRHDLDTVNSIALAPAQSVPTVVYAQQCQAFDVERVTNAFYKEYARRFQDAKARIKQENPGIVGFYEPARLHTFTQRLFGRLMFLYFLQKKGALNNRQDFLNYWYERAEKENENFYCYVLETLFFETLNVQRPAGLSARFGKIPYLNGGLFAADEHDLRGHIYLDNELFDAGSESGLLYFLGNHNFTIEEDTPLEVEVALDPEMLGKVFENLLESEERGKSGTFYTPRPVVAFMCREALATYLVRETQLDEERLAALLDEAEMGTPVLFKGEPKLSNQTLPRSLRQRVDTALFSVRVLDPAVGSGAFPLGMLALLVGVRRALYRIEGVAVAPHSHMIEGWKRDFIRDCLYGVDIKQEAIEIARLRLWLSLVVDANPFDMEPLPNLDYKLMSGDSLIETCDGVEIYPTRPIDTAGKAETKEMFESSTKLLIRKLHTLTDTLYQPDEQINRAELKQHIHETEYAIVNEKLEEQEKQNETKLNELLSKLRWVQGRKLPKEEKEIEKLQRKIALVKQAKADIRAGKTLPFFLYRLHFASVFEEKDGFDIVIANPPYVSIEHMTSNQKNSLKLAYSEIASGRADLYVYFYARALQLLHEGGTLSFITSNKYFRAGYGAKLREVLTNETQVKLVLDFGDRPVFDAAAYPCVVVTSKGRPGVDHCYSSWTASPTYNVEELNKLEAYIYREGQLQRQEDGVAPAWGTSAEQALAKKIKSKGTPLGEYVHEKIFYGIKTGLNKAFIVDQAAYDRLIAEDPRSAEVLKPYLCGEDIKLYKIDWKNKWLIYTYHGIEIKNFPAIERYLTHFKKSLEERATEQAWYELQQPQNAYFSAFEQPKIVFPDIAQQPKFVWTESPFFISNTAYCIPTEKVFLSGLLNSKLIHFIYASISPQIRGGFFRFIYQYMEKLPIVEPNEKSQNTLLNAINKFQKQGYDQSLQQEIDNIIYTTYSLSQDEIITIEEWHSKQTKTSAEIEAPLQSEDE